MNDQRVTKDGLPVVTDATFLEVVTTYPIASAVGDPVVRERLETENPQIYRILKIGAKNAPDTNSRSYYIMGIEIAYELLRAQSAKNSVK